MTTPNWKHNSGKQKNTKGLCKGKIKSRKQSLAGKAELQKAEYTRQVAVLEAQAKKDSAQQLADAEIIRATGVAKANQIIGDSLKDNREYLQYLYITGLEDGSKNGNVTIYVPTEGGMPVPTLQMNK